MTRLPGLGGPGGGCGLVVDMVSEPSVLVRLQDGSTTWWPQAETAPAALPNREQYWRARAEDAESALERRERPRP